MARDDEEAVLGSPMFAGRREILVGFSQGGYMSYRMVLEHPHVFDAAILMSPSFKGEESTDLTGFDSPTRFLLLYGSRDRTIPPADQQTARRVLEATGRLEYREYPGMGQPSSTRRSATFVAVARRNVVEHVHVESGQFRAEPTFQPFDGLRDCGLGDAGRGGRGGKAAAAMPELRGGAAIAACRHRHARSTVAQVSRIAGTPGRAGDFDVNGSRRVDCFLRTRRTSCVAPRIRPQRLASPCRTLIQSHPHGMAHGPFRGALAPADRRNAAPTAQEHRHARPCAGGPTVMQIGRIGGGNGHAHTVAGD